jgi:hypothetical protein
VFEDTKGVIRIRKSKKDKQHNGQKKKDKQHNGQKKKKQKEKQRSTKRTHKTKDIALKIRNYCSLKNNKFVVGT